MIITSVNRGLDNGGGCDGMHRGSAAMNDCVEPVVVVSSVGHGTHRAVGLHQAVLAPHHIAVAFLPLALDVSCMGVVHTIIEAVLGVGLQVQTVQPTLRLVI